MGIKDELKKELSEVLLKMGVENIEPLVETPADSKHGDYATNVAMVAAKKSFPTQNPMMVGAAIKMALDEKDIPFLSNIEVVSPGFINFRVSDSYMLLQLPRIAGGGAKSAIPDIGKGKKVIVEYSSPNIAKPFTVGHLRSTIIGDAVANLLDVTGWEVQRDNHLGDWGTQFGKQIYAIKTWGNEEEIEKSDRPVKELVALYVKFHEEAEKDSSLEDKAREWFKKLEDGDAEARRLWERCIEWSWKEFDTIYQELGVSFTENNGRGYGESFFEDKMGSVIAELKDKGLLKDGEEGAKLIFFPEDKYPPLMILKKDGSTLYSTRDLATDKFRLERYGKEVVVINEIGAEQSLYMQQIYEAEKLLNWYKEGQRIHIKHGLYRFKEGKMSTRKGNVVWLEDVLEEAKMRATALAKDSEDKSLASKELSKVVGIGAIKWNDLKRDSKQDIVFDWDDILNMQGNSGPYIQYTYARTQSVLRRVENNKPQSASEVTDNGLQPEEREILRLLVGFGETVESAATRYAPSILTNYLFEVAQAFNLFYQRHQILKVEGESKQLRLTLTEGTASVLKRGLHLLGIQAPVKM